MGGVRGQSAARQQNYMKGKLWMETVQRWCGETGMFQQHLLSFIEFSCLKDPSLTRSQSGKVATTTPEKQLLPFCAFYRFIAADHSCVEMFTTFLQ